MKTTLVIMIGLINPAALPALRIAGALFLTVNLLAGAYIIRRWRRFFAPDPAVVGDTEITSHVRLELILIPWLALTTFLVVEGLRLWIS